MGWRTVVISNTCKLSYKNDYLIIRSDNLQMIHLSEINIIIIDTGTVYEKMKFGKKLLKTKYIIKLNC